MRRAYAVLAFPIVVLLLTACSSDSDDDEVAVAPTGPVLVDSYSPGELVALLAGNEAAQLLANALLAPECTVNVHQLDYQTADPAGNATPASGALMIPTGAGTACQGERPIMLYAHGTSTDKAFNIADLENNGEGLILAAVFASQGYIVVAPNYVGYDGSTLAYHPYVNGSQQSRDMRDALAAARSAVPTASAPTTTAGARLFVTGYSQGGYVAMATHRALQSAGQSVTASAPMSGPYALSAFGDAIFAGQVPSRAPDNLTLLLASYQGSYGNIYVTATEAFEARYAAGIATLLPSTTPIAELRNQGRIPREQLFSSTPPDPAYASVTPATTPANIAPVFARGFGSDNLLTNSFRLAYLQDALNNPDGGFPIVSDGLPPVAPANSFRQALKLNDLRNWTPTSPVLLCAGNGDPAVFFLNTTLMQNYWASTTTVAVLDIDSAAVSGDPYESQKEQFAIAKEVIRLGEGEGGVLDAYHTTLVAPFCLSAVKAFFDGL